MSEADADNQNVSPSRREAAERLRRLIPEILRQWEERARDEVVAARKQNRPVLRDNMPRFLEDLADSLVQSTECGRRVAFSTSKEHAEQRATLPDYSLEQVIQEYYLLRAVILPVLEAEGPLGLDARTCLHHCLDRAIQVAATHYVQIMQQSLALSESRFRAFFRQAAVGVGLIDLSGQFVLVNQKLCDLLGRPMDDVLCLRWQDVVHPEERSKILTLIENAARDSREFVVEQRYVQPDGSVVWANVSTSVVSNEAGRPEYIMGVAQDITARKRIEAERERLLKELTSHRALFEAVLDQMPAGVSISESPSGKGLYHNREAIRLLGHPLIAGEDYTRFASYRAVHKDGTPYAPEDYPTTRAVLYGEVIHGEEMRYLRPDDTEVVLSINSAPVVDAEGRRLGVTTFVDITQRKRVEEERDRLIALEQEARSEAERERDFIRLVLENSPILIGVVEGPEFCFTLLNPATVTFTGLPREDLLGRTVSEVLPEAYPVIRPYLERVYHQGTTEVLPDLELPLPGDRVLWASIVYAPLRDPSGQVVGVVYLAVDITDRKRIEETLRENEQRLQLALQAGEMGIWDWDLTTNAVVWSETLERLFGLEPGAFEGSIDAAMTRIHPEDREAVSSALTESIECGEDYSARWRVIWPDGTLHWLAARGQTQRAASGKPIKVTGVCWDITDQYRTEETQRFLAEASRVLGFSLDYQTTLERVARLIVPHLADWCAVDLVEDDDTIKRVVVFHTDPTKVAWAYELQRRYPLSPDSPYGTPKVLRTGQSDFYPDVPDSLLAAITRDEEHRRMLQEVGMRSVVVVPLIVRERTLGTITFVFAESGRRYEPDDLIIFEDLARRVATAIDNARLFQALREADQRKNEFLAMLAHELRNPLAPIQNAIYAMRWRGAQDPGTQRSLDVVERQLRQMVRLVDDLLDVSRITRGRVELRREVVNLGTVVENAVETSRPLIEERRHELSVSVPMWPLRLQADPARLEQVIVNLLNNAAKYTEPGGRIWVTAMREGEEAVFRVRDTGRGIPAEMLPHIFDLFTQVSPSLDRATGGLGLGLTLVKSLVEMHGGKVAASSAGPGQGSEFMVRLPALPAERPQERPAAIPAADVNQRSVRVLIVDDNKDAAETLADLLELWNYQVTCAHDGTKVLEVAQTFQPELILLDIGLPGMDGYAVAAALRRDPATASTRLVALTGYGQEEDRRRSREAGFDDHLVKPIDPERLQRLLSTVSEAKRGNEPSG